MNYVTSSRLTPLTARTRFNQNSEQTGIEPTPPFIANQLSNGNMCDILYVCIRFICQLSELRSGKVSCKIQAARCTVIYTSPQVLMQINDSLSTRPATEICHIYGYIQIYIYIDMSQESQASMSEVLYSSTIG